MKKIKISIKSAVLLLLVSFVFSSCLKDKPVDQGQIGIKVDGGMKIVEIAGPASGFTNVDLVGSPKDTTVNLVVVRLASDKPAETDIQVTLVSDHSMVTAYNTANGTNYQAPPAAVYQIPSLTVTIPKGEREGFLKLTAIPNNLFGASYAFGFKIASVSDPSMIISGNFSKQVVALIIRNKYDGVYTMKSQQLDWLNNTPFNIVNTMWTWPYDVHLVTSGSNRVNLFSVAHNSYILPTIGTTGPSGFGNTNPRFVFDITTDKITAVINDINVNRTFAIDPTFDNRFDPVTKNIFVRFKMMQAGRTDLLVYIEFTYKEPRP